MSTNWNTREHRRGNTYSDGMDIIRFQLCDVRRPYAVGLDFVDIDDSNLARRYQNAGCSFSFEALLWGAELTSSSSPTMVSCAIFALLYIYRVTRMRNQGVDAKKLKSTRDVDGDVWKRWVDNEKI
jgi:hypothetical protein